jgi:hypothetical protein
MTFDDQLHALIFFHLQEHESARDRIQHLKEDDFANEWPLRMEESVAAVSPKLSIINKKDSSAWKYHPVI